MRLLIAGGGTGGHLYPALAVARAFRVEQPNGAVLLVGREGGPEERLVPVPPLDPRRKLGDGPGLVALRLVVAAQLEGHDGSV